MAGCGTTEDAKAWGSLAENNMNWYIDLKDPIVLFSDSIVLIAPSLNKFSSTRQHEISVSKQDNGDGTVARINMVDSKNKIEINVTFVNNIWSFPLYSEVWLYPKNEIKRAVKTYNRVVNVLEDLKADVEDDELPTPSVQGKVRENLRYIDPDRKRPVNNASLEAARHEEGETDWRNSIYGNRYPSQVVYIDNKGTIQISNGDTPKKS